MNYEDLLNYGYQIIKGLNYLHKNSKIYIKNSASTQGS